MAQLLNIGDASRIVGVSVETLRNWEKAGKVQPERSSNGSRLYRRADVNRLRDERLGELREQVRVLESSAT